jgi:hypothetical protein
MSAATAEPAQAENPFAGQGSVLLDIGDEVGAVVVSMPDGMAGVEVEIRPADGGARQRHGHSHGEVHHPHVAVVNRPVAGGLVPSLVFPEVHEGHYGLHLKGSAELVMSVHVVGGEVTSAEWPD